MTQRKYSRQFQDGRAKGVQCEEGTYHRLLALALALVALLLGLLVGSTTTFSLFLLFLFLFLLAVVPWLLLLRILLLPPPFRWTTIRGLKKQWQSDFR